MIWLKLLESVVSSSNGALQLNNVFDFFLLLAFVVCASRKCEVVWFLFFLYFFVYKVTLTLPSGGNGEDNKLEKNIF